MVIGSSFYEAKNGYGVKALAASWIVRSGPSAQPDKAQGHPPFPVGHCTATT